MKSGPRQSCHIAYKFCVICVERFIETGIFITTITRRTECSWTSRAAPGCVMTALDWIWLPKMEISLFALKAGQASFLFSFLEMFSFPCVASESGSWHIFIRKSPSSIGELNSALIHQRRITPFEYLLWNCLYLALFLWIAWFPFLPVKARSPTSRNTSEQVLLAFHQSHVISQKLSSRCEECCL